MKKLLDRMTEEVSKAFEKAGYDGKYGKVTASNRPDLCEYQCNGAMAAAKQYHKAPFLIADEVAKCLPEGLFSKAESVKPGFLNLDLDAGFLASYVREMQADPRYGAEKTQNPKTIIIDYGGPNVAKPLHVGHLRSAVIGESIKRIGRYEGHNMIGDVHLGDWGLQMGLIITELHERRPDLVYFDENYEGEYPEEAPFTISELEEIYPTASGKSKEDESYKEAAMQATYELQHGRRGYRALLNHILDVSVTDLKKNYERLNVSFELWKGESDAQPYVPDMVQKMKDEGYAHESQGALVVDVAEEGDAKEIPPCMILKSDGASLYNTTDLATIVWRMQDYHPDQIIYVVDKRQELYFTQVFRCARKTKLVDEDTELTFVGFGTMNGKDGKPFKTREGGVMRLETLVGEVEDRMYEKICDSGTLAGEEARQTAQTVALAAIKYGDLSNQPSKDYIFDIDRFISFEGNTGPYILYTIVRMKSILKKYQEGGNDIAAGEIPVPASESVKALMLQIAGWTGTAQEAFAELAPNRICSYVYGLAEAFNHFYHQTPVLSEKDPALRAGYIRLLDLTRGILEICIDLLGFSAPERM